MKTYSWAALVATMLVAGCAGSATSGFVPVQRSGPVSQTPALSPAAIAIKVPFKVNARHGVSPHYVSPSVQSASIAVTPIKGCSTCSAAVKLNVALTPDSSSCTQAAGGTTCTLHVALKPGTYTGAMTTYDGPLVSKKPTGTILSLAQSFPVKILAGKANVVSVVLDGVPHTLSFENLTASKLEIFDGNEPFIVAPGETSRFAVYAIDVDGNTILGPGAPTFSMSSTPAGYTASVSGNVISLKATSHVSDTLGIFGIKETSPACKASGAICGAYEFVTTDSLVAIASAGNNTVQIFSRLALYAGSGAPYATISNGISTPTAVKFDASGNLFVVNSTGNSVTEYAPPYTGAPVATEKLNLNQPFAIALAPDGNTMAVTNQGANTVELYGKPFGSGSHWEATLPNAGDRAGSVAFDSSSNIWLTISIQDEVLRYTAGTAWGSSDILLNAANNSISAPEAVLLDENNDLYVADNGSGQLDEFDAGYTGFPTHSATGIGGLLYIAIDSGSNFVAACSINGPLVFQAVKLTQYGGLTTGTDCIPAFDRFADLVAVQGTNQAMSLTYSAPANFTNIGRTFSSPLVNQPRAIAAWP